MRLAAAIVAAWLTVIAAPVFAQQPEPLPDATELAKKTQNPVGDLIAVPFQFNFNTGGDLGDETLFNLNFQPVIPFKLTDNWSMIARTIVPLYSIPSANGISYSGVGDIQEQLFVTPAHPGKLIWGVGTGEGPTLAYVDANPPNGTPVTVPAFGRIFGRQDVLPGPYTDNVPVRILF